MKIIGLAFAEQPLTRMRWLCGVVADIAGDWCYVELPRSEWIAVPDETVPESALAQLHERIAQSRN